MAGLIDRIGALAGTDLGKAVDLGHRFYQERMDVHNHMGRAILETAAEVARNHPNLVGIGAGLLVEQFLSEQKRRHDVFLAEREGEAEAGGAPRAAGPEPAVAPPPRSGLGPFPFDLHVPLVHHELIQLNRLRPGRVAFEVFGALVLLKLASSGLRWFRHDHQHEAWFAPAARIRLWSGTFATYYLLKSLQSPRISAWRNAAVALFATDALKPVLNSPRRRSAAVQPSPPAAALAASAPPFSPPAPRPPPPAEAPPEAVAPHPLTPPSRPRPDAPALH